MFNLQDYRCPKCIQKLKIDSNNGHSLACECGKKFSVVSNIPNFIYPENLLPNDKEFKEKYDQNAQNYDIGLDWLFTVFSEDSTAIRKQLISLLELKPNYRVLEIGAGTGEDSHFILKQLGETGELFVQDISIGMLKIAEQKLVNHKNIKYSLANGSYLPFPDNFFDAVYHFGGINTFDEKKKAIFEMNRVCREGGKVVFGDESISPWLKRKTYGKILIKANKLYKYNPPLEYIPENARDVTLRWLLGNAFYVIDFRASDLPLPLDIDLTIPGKKDTLRSRYYG